MFKLMCKYSENREQNKINLFVFYAEVHPILFKYSENREQNKINLFVFYAEVHPILLKNGHC